MGGNHSCNICSRGFDRMWKLRTHLNEDHARNKIFPNYCHDCRKSFQSKPDLWTHRRLVHGGYSGGFQKSASTQGEQTRSHGIRYEYNVPVGNPFSPLQGNWQRGSHIVLIILSPHTYHTIFTVKVSLIMLCFARIPRLRHIYLNMFVETLHYPTIIHHYAITTRQHHHTLFTLRNQRVPICIISFQFIRQIESHLSQKYFQEI